LLWTTPAAESQVGPFRVGVGVGRALAVDRAPAMLHCRVLRIILSMLNKKAFRIKGLALSAQML